MIPSCHISFPAISRAWKISFKNGHFQGPAVDLPDFYLRISTIFSWIFWGIPGSKQICPVSVLAVFQFRAAPGLQQENSCSFSRPMMGYPSQMIQVWSIYQHLTRKSPKSRSICHTWSIWVYFEQKNGNKRNTW